MRFINYIRDICFYVNVNDGEYRWAVGIFLCTEPINFHP